MIGRFSLHLRKLKLKEADATIYYDKNLNWKYQTNKLGNTSKRKSNDDFNDIISVCHHQASESWKHNFVPRINPHVQSNPEKLSSEN